MKTAIVFYSYSGKTRAWAEKYKTTLEDAQVFEVKEKKNRNGFTAVIPGCIQAASLRRVPVVPESIDLSGFDRIVIAAPIWASHPAPAFNSIAAMVPSGKEVELFITSSSGNSERGKKKVIKSFEDRGITVVGYHDVKTKE